jgi:saccharopine dehydrogenase (NAD+, L-lysine-forming)
MKRPPHLWLRHESRAHEHRTPVVPSDAAALVAAGFTVTVEDSPVRAFPPAAYAAAGCAIAPAGSWPGAPAHAVVVGLKELPPGDEPLRHRHVFFGHAYKGQPGAAALLRRFTGDGALLDLESLTDDDGRRVAAFGHWAGYAGAALAILHRLGRLPRPLRPGTRRDLDRLLAPRPADPPVSALVIGALGRCGGGARAALAAAGVVPTCWDLAETRTLDRAALLAHDVLVNAVLAERPMPPFLTEYDVADPGRRLAVIADVTCDVGSPYHALPIYRSTTSWTEPVHRLPGPGPALDVVAIDNLPSLLPRESSLAFSADLLPHLLALGAEPGGEAPQWRRCLSRFHRAREALDTETDPIHV